MKFQSPLHDLHLKYGAKLTEFAGWQLPVSFKGIIEEHNHTRTSVSFFDTSHMGQFYFEGENICETLKPLFARTVKGTPNKCTYLMLIQPNKQVIDDCVVNTYSPTNYRL